MGRVPITVMGYRCERCSHEWIPRGGAEKEPRVCPKCRSPYWNTPRKRKTTYEDFQGGDQCHARQSRLFSYLDRASYRCRSAAVVPK